MEKQQKQCYLTEPLFVEEKQQQNSVKFKPVQPNLSNELSSTQTNNKNSFSFGLNRRSQSTDKPEIAREKKVLNFQLPNEYYYENKKVKPGINLYKIFLETQERRIEEGYKGPQLNLPIPDTILYFENIYYLVKYNYENGKLEIQKNLHFMQYLAYFKSFAEEGAVTPTGVIMNGNGITLDRTIVMSNDVCLKSLPKNQNQVLSKYVMPYRFFPNMLRLFFFPKGTRTIKKNFAYKIVNKNQMTDELFKRKYKLEHQFFVVTEKQENNLNVNVMHGGSIETCEKMAQSLTEYLQKAKGVKIFELVIDFIVDSNKVIWFSELKSVKSKSLTTIWQVGTDEQIEALANQKNSVIPCGLCEMMFQKQEIKRLVTNKLIYEFITHLQIRGVQLNFPKSRNKIDGMANVCDICYELIVAQHRLIDVERQFSKMMNMGENCIERVPLKGKGLAQPVLNNLFGNSMQSSSAEVEINISKGILTAKSSLLQWRMIIFIHKVKNIKNVNYQPGEKLEIEMDIKNGKLKDKFAKILNIGNSSVDGALVQTRFKSSVVSSGRRIQNLNFYSNQNSNHLQHSNLKPSRTTFSNSNTLKNSSVQRNNIANLENENLSDQQNAKNSSVWKDMASRATTAKTRNFGLITNHTANTLQCNYSLQQEQSLSASIQYVKMHTFYTTSDDISKFLENSKIKFSMKYMDEKFTGDTSTLQSFHNKKSCQRHSSEVYLFDSGLRYCNMELTTGLICDGYISNIQPQSLTYSADDNVFFLKKNINGMKLQPLPEQWMEIFTDGKIPYSFEPVEKIEVGVGKLGGTGMGMGMGLANVKSLDRFSDRNYSRKT